MEGGRAQDTARDALSPTRPKRLPGRTWELRTPIGGWSLQTGL